MTTWISFDRSSRAAALALALAGVLGGCAPAAVAPAAEPTPAAEPGPPTTPFPAAMEALPRDIHSFARPEEARVTHVGLDLRTDFATRTLSGTATLNVQAAPGADEIVLDTRGLDVQRVTDGAGVEIPWEFGAEDSVLGRPLTVGLAPETRRIVIHYRTSPEAGALQWLTPEQTAGRRHPFLFSQGQAILTRTWIPTQDSPGIRQSYDARITVPAELTAVMSADMLTPRGETVAGGRAFRFKLDTPVPPYLIALAVGDLAFRATGPRTGVWTEPATLDRAAYELAELERFVDAAEALYGPYRWGRYDVLVLPPSFPFGGMENPRLTFATPTILAGDRSLVSLIAHELAHSWSGNLVTNATWADFWLNEGFTTYFENRIMEALYGPERAAMLASLGWGTLQEAIEGAGGPGAADTRLHIDLAGRDPDAGMTEIPYEKGATFLRTLEQAFGRARWDAYLRGYFDRHAFQPMTTERFLEDLRANLIRGDSALERRLMLQEWAYGTGVPSNAVRRQSDAFARVEAQAQRFVAGTPAAQLTTQQWSTQEWQHFLGALPRGLTPAQLADLDRAFRLSEQGNAEILFAWLQMAVRHRYEPALPALERFLTGMGRRKFVRPLFTSLMEQGEWGRAHAQRIYRIARPGYHPVTSGSVDEIVR